MDSIETLKINKSETLETIKELIVETTLNNSDVELIHKHVSVLQMIYDCINLLE